VVDRAAGRSPRPEWEYYSGDIGAWLRADENTARQHAHHRRVRKTGDDWCVVMGRRTGVADDITLQMYFLTVRSDEWPRLALAVMRRPTRCLSEWRAVGSRIVAAVSPGVPASGRGPLWKWPEERGIGARSMLPH
jgi:hypothetical protein